MRIEIEFNADNAAFEGDYFLDEVEFVLRQAHRKLRRLRTEGADEARLVDSNGNAVGAVRVEGEREPR